MRSLALESWHRSQGAQWMGSSDTSASNPISSSASSSTSSSPPSSALSEDSPRTPLEVQHYGDVSAEYAAITQGGGGLFDASSRDRLLVTGPDAVSFLQGLATQELEGHESGTSVEAAFITAKGKLITDARVTLLDDGVLLDMEGGGTTALQEHFSRYLINEEVSWMEVSEALVQLQVWGPGARKSLDLESSQSGDVTAVSLAGAELVGVVGDFAVELFVPGEIAEAVVVELKEKLAAQQGRPVGRAALEPYRIEQGLGRFGIDWNESTNPLEAGLDRALSFGKGCYIGQEVVAKATYIGRVNRRLVRLRYTGTPLPSDTPLIGGRAPGRLTSSAQIPQSDTVVALGYVRRDMTPAGSELRLGEGEDAPTARVEGWPFASKEKPID